MTNIPFIADGGYNSASASSVALTKPAGVIAGNILVAFVAVQDSAGLAVVTVNTLAGWTRIVDSPYSPIQFGVRAIVSAFWKIAGTSEPATYTWTGTANGGTISGMDGNIRAYEGTKGVTPINGTGTGSAGIGGPTNISAINEATFAKGEKAVYCLIDTGNVVNSTGSPTALSDVFTAGGIFESFVIGDFDPTATPGIETLGAPANSATAGLGFTLLPGPPPLTSFISRFARNSLGRFPFNSADSPVPSVGRENFHFVPDFKPRALAGFKFNSWDVEPPVVDQENPHFVSVFRNAVLAGFPYNSWDVEPPVLDQENPHFMGRFQVPVLRSFRYTNIADIPLVIVIPETNTYFAPVFSPAVLRGFQFNSWDVQPPVADRENPHFVSDFKATAFFNYFRYNTWDPTGLNTPSILPPPPPPPPLLEEATVAAYHRRTIQKNFDITGSAQNFAEDMVLEAIIQLALTGDVQSIQALDRLRDSQVSVYGGSLDWRTLQGLQ